MEKMPCYAYTQKDLKDEWTRIRKECQECPNKRFYKKYNKMRPVRNVKGQQRIFTVD
jgi:hypothetical protein